ncbi:MAG: P-II family nitrogen regulator [Myxococcales bacterium]
MKKIEAIIKPSKLEAVKKALARVCNEAPTFTDAVGLARQRAHTVRYRGAEFRIDALPMLKLELVVANEAVGRVLEAIFEAARTGSKGDGRIFVLPVEEVIRIRTGERGEVAA